MVLRTQKYALPLLQRGAFEAGSSEILSMSSSMRLVWTGVTIAHPQLSFPQGSRTPVCDQPPLPRKKSPSWNPEWHPIDDTLTHATHTSDTRMLRPIPTIPAMNPSLRTNPRRCPAPCTHPQDHYPRLPKPIQEPRLTTRVACDTTPQMHPSSASRHYTAAGERPPARV